MIRGTNASALKLGVFVVFSLAMIATIAATIRPFGQSTASSRYTAVFTSASRLQPGDDVRVAGVAAGTVRDVRVTSDARAEVTFDLADDVPISTTSRLEIRYLDLAGNRYLAVLDGAARSSRDLAEEPVRQPSDRTIGTGRTQPALDLDTLLDGFKPLLVALSPDDVNALALDIVQILQGDGATVRSLLSRTASVTTTLAERDALINDLIRNLDTAVGTVADRHRDLESLIGDLRSVTGTLAADRRTVGQAIGHLDTMTALTAELLADIRPSTKQDIAALAEVAGTLASPLGRSEIRHALDHLPDKLTRLTATAAYGSWFNYYVCGVRLSLAETPGISAELKKTLESLHIVDSAPRCAR